ncbi:DUF4249 domain-containing protein [Flavobacterium aciduliphilum]|uniref:Uncharacterized protein DUF4249 n=1 Tax=Flavobacterium aciduliphilum TaxID=1101402 RepID=A0A328YTR1_9FLAO|nr:DUF4249 domain-containing protein [Flavobacterium aciduliphilum]RAR75592.1 uncharacterized protein DUF4249 [Flavobacterium aciduliphilum]
MKKRYSILSFLVISLTLISCEDKVNIPLETAAPKLVIEANILWQKGTAGNEQKIKLTTTTDYYNENIPTVSGAVVSVTDVSNPTPVLFPFVETPNTGEYVCHTFIPIINHDYLLTIAYNGQSYTATEKLLATPTIDNVQQTTVQGFGGERIQVKFFYQDNGNEDNYYLIGVKNSTKAIPEYGVVDDTFFQGNQMFGFYSDEKLKAGDQLLFSLEGISLRYYNYMNKLLNIAGNSNGSPFSTPPATLRGNIINQTDDNNYPLGYFHLSEIDTRNYIVQ